MINASLSTLYCLHCAWLRLVVPKPGGMGGIYPPNNLAVSPPIVWEWSTCASPPIILNGCTAERKFGEKSVLSRWRPFFFALHLKSGRKSVLFLKKLFFFGDHLFLGWKTVWICNFGRKIRLNFGDDLFFFFLEITCFWAEKPFEFSTPAEIFGSKQWKFESRSLAVVSLFQILATRLVFTKFPHLNKIVVEVHPPQCWK